MRTEEEQQAICEKLYRKAQRIVENGSPAPMSIQLMVVKGQVLDMLIMSDGVATSDWQFALDYLDEKIKEWEQDEREDYDEFGNSKHGR
jgi:hypothetical protein